VKRGKLGFTMVEILAVVGIIAILVAVLIPALTMVRRIAKETQQRAQLTAIDLALIAFKADYGDYPPSSWQGNLLRTDYSGAQMLAEALLGWDLVGFHPDSAWRADGRDEDGIELVYDLTGTDEEDEENLRARRGPYLELATANAFRLGNILVDKPGLFNDYGAVLEPDTFVLCDVFSIRRIALAAGGTVRAGTPILYYRANTSSRTMEPSVDVEKRIYNAYDNYYLVERGSLTPDGRPGELHPLFYPPGDLEKLYDYDYNGGIRDPKITATRWPHRPDSYILISAGADGLYGTSDDICNF